MAIPSQEEETVSTEEQMGEEVEETTETDEPNPEDTKTDDEFDEITYNKETVKIPKSERQAYLQKGYNYDKVHGRLSEHEKKLVRLKELTGMDIDAALTSLEQQIQQQQVEQYASEHDLTEEDAKREVERDRRLQELETETKMTKRLLTLNQEKAPLKDKIFFKELESEIDQLVTENAKRGVDVNVETAYHYLRGQKLEELMGQEKGKAVKSTIADVQDRMKRGGIVTGSESASADIVDGINTAMAAAFGNDPKEIAKYVKQQIKRR